MNGRPIIYDGDTFISIQDVIYAALSRDQEETILECPESIEEHYEAFCEAFIESVAWADSLVSEAKLSSRAAC